VHRNFIISVVQFIDSPKIVERFSALICVTSSPIIFVQILYPKEGMKIITHNAVLMFEVLNFPK
jgi:hypothetical protein